MKIVDATARISFKNILLATDFSPVSDAALCYAKGIARRYGSKILVTHVVSPGEGPMVPPEDWGACQQLLDEAAKREMEALSAGLNGIPHDTVLCYGAVWDGLSALIEKGDVDLLIMGTHGREGLKRLVMGSIAEEVFRRASCPVLTIGPNAATDTESEANFKEIVLATDLSPQWQGAANYAISLAQDYQARLTLVHAVTQSVEGLADMERITTARMEDLRALVPPDADLWCRPEYRVEFGDPAQQIIGAARERKADLIVLGVRPAVGRLGAATHLGSATAHGVVSLASCPVLSVRH